MSDMAFLLAIITVSGGQNIVWKNFSQVIHNVEDDASKALDMADVMLPSSVKLFDSNFCNPIARLPAFSQCQESTVISALCMKPTA
jgi:F420-dependent methylenetetrahydromethanopterin dehydrogenase